MMKKRLCMFAIAVVGVVPAYGQSPPPKAPVDECTTLWKDFDLDDDDFLSDAEAARLSRCWLPLIRTRMGISAKTSSWRHARKAC